MVPALQDAHKCKQGTCRHLMNMEQVRLTTGVSGLTKDEFEKFKSAMCQDRDGIQVFLHRATKATGT